MIDIGNTLIGTVVGGIITLLGFYINNVLSKKQDVKKEVTIAEIQLDKEDHERIKKDLQSALNSIKELKKALDKSEKDKVEIEHKFEAVKLAFKIIFNQYAKQFKSDPEQLDMLEELKEIIES